MSKRNVILLIVVLSVIVMVAYIFFYFYQPKTQTTVNEPGVINFFANFYPFSKSDLAENSPEPNSPTEPDNGQSNDSKLKKISGFPIAGYGLFSKERFKEIPEAVPTDQTDSRGQKITPVAPPTEFAPAVRYVDRATGNIYQTFVDKIDERKFSSTVIPKVYEAFFGNNGQSVVMRYLKSDNRTIETFIGSLPKEYLGADSIGTSEITGSFLPENITDVSVSPDNSSLFYLFNNGESAIGVNYSFINNTKTQIFSSPFTEWLSNWAKDNLITLTTKPSANFAGFVYSIDPSKKDFKKVFGNINALTSLMSPDGKKLLFSNDNLSLSIFDTETKNSNSVGLRTLPEKCVWSSNDVVYCAVPKYIDRLSYPDAWYQGLVSFSDEIWKIDISSGSTLLLADPTLINGEEVDATKLNLDSNQNYLLFVNKKDSRLWELSLR